MVLVAQFNGNSRFKAIGQSQLTPINFYSSFTPIARRLPKFSEGIIPVVLRDTREIPIRKLLNTLEQINVERFSEWSEGFPMTLIIGVSVGIVGLLLCFQLIVGRWIVR